MDWQMAEMRPLAMPRIMAVWAFMQEGMPRHAGLIGSYPVSCRLIRIAAFAWSRWGYPGNAGC